MPSSSPSSSSYLRPVETYELPEKSNQTLETRELSDIQYATEGQEEDSRFSMDSTQSTQRDQRDMQRLGRKQEMRRDYRSLSMLAFVVIVQGTWEFVLVSLTQGLTDGGIAGMFWSFVWTFIGFIPIVASLSEMASMAPTSGGQYHWVSEFAPAKYQKTMSYFAEWISTLAWQAGNASGYFVTGGIIQGLIYVNNNNYTAPAWHLTLIVIANVAIIFVINVWFAKWIPYLQNGLLGFHIFMFLAVIIPLWVLAPHASATEVFITGFDASNGGWPNLGLSLMICQISAIWGCLGSDAAAHMAEETKDAAIVVPQSMMYGYILNGFMGIVLVVTVCFALPDLYSALNDTTGWPFLYAFNTALSPPAVNAITTGVLVLIFASNLTYSASTGRETYAFARDNGLPFPKFLGKIHPTLRIPANALGISSIISILLSLINIGSATAFNAIISLNTCAIMLSYTVSIGSVLWRRINCPETLPPARWSLGRYGLPVNIAGVTYCVWAFFWSFWPNYYPVTVDYFNWSSVIFGGVCVVAGVMFVVKGRFVFEGPVALVEGRRRRKSGGEYR